MKKVLILIAGLIVVLGIFLVTAKKDNGEDGSANKIKVVATTTMVTDLVKEIAGEKIEVNGLMGAGVDPHLYKASEGDVAKLSEAKAIFYNGLHLEGKLDDIFEKMKNRGIKVYALAESIDKSKLIPSDEFDSNFDPHVWFSTKLWKELAEHTGELLGEVDPENADYYISRASDYVKKIDEFERYSFNKIEKLPKDQRILITAHDAFNYFGKVYGFEVLGLQGLSTASEAGVQDVKNLADYIYEKKVKAIFIESSVPRRNIEALQQAVESRGFKVEIGGELFSDALGNPGTSEGTYLGMFKHNMDTVVGALAGE
jgi:manganese/zinc/iron transport system substrate-binding protein